MTPHEQAIQTIRVNAAAAAAAKAAADRAAAAAALQRAAEARTRLPGGDR